MFPTVPNPAVLLAAGTVWLASLAGVGWWQRQDGAAVERAAWQARDNAQLRRASARIVELTAAARAAERTHGEVVAAIATRYEEELKHANDQRARDRAAVLAGGLRLRDPAAPGLRADGSAVCPAVAAAGERDGRAAGELSGAATGFLLDLANNSDAVADQLAACQRLVIEDRRLCGGE